MLLCFRWDTPQCVFFRSSVPPSPVMNKQQNIQYSRILLRKWEFIFSRGFFYFLKNLIFYLLSQKMSQNGPKCKKIALQGIISQQYVQWSWYLVHIFLKSFDYNTRYRHKKVKKGPKWHQQKIITRNWGRLKRLRADPSPVSEPRISQGHVIKRSCDIIGKSPSREAINLPSLVAIDTLVIEI